VGELKSKIRMHYKATRNHALIFTKPTWCNRIKIINYYTLYNCLGGFIVNFQGFQLSPF